MTGKESSAWTLYCPGINKFLAIDGLQGWWCVLCKSARKDGNQRKNKVKWLDRVAFGMYQNWLVVSTPLKNMKVSWDYEIPNRWKVIKFHGSKPPTRKLSSCLRNRSSDSRTKNRQMKIIITMMSWWKYVHQKNKKNDLLPVTSPSLVIPMGEFRRNHGIFLR